MFKLKKLKQDLLLSASTMKTYYLSFKNTKKDIGKDRMVVTY